MIFDLPFVVIISFLQAFFYNFMIAVIAMIIGCTIGALLGSLINVSSKSMTRSLKIVRSLFCNVPSFVLLFYFTLIVPSQFELLDESWPVPPILKAILALSIPVIGYYSDIFERIFKGEMHFSIASLKQFFIVILMASTTASVIGVNEIIATANAYIASQGDSSKMLSVYLFVAFIFTLSGFLVQGLFYLANLFCLKLFRPSHSLLESAKGE